jgi:hypothetical protein
MDTALTVVILLLTLLLVLIVLLYFFTQQGFRDVVARMAVSGAGGPAPAAAQSQRSADAVRRERSVAHDQLVLLEADLAIEPREALTTEEVEAFEASRKAIKTCNAELKKMGQWMGLPFDLEWVEIQQRQPKVNELYRVFVESQIEKVEQPNT